MEKKRQGIFVLLILSLLSSVFVLVACNSNEADGPIKLTTPTVTLSENNAVWEANDNADKFEISLNGNLSYIENIVASKKLENGQTFKIRAIGDGKNYLNSEWSNAVTYTINEPSSPVEKFTVEFLDYDNSIIDVQFVDYDGSAIAPDSPNRNGYRFIGWNMSFSNVVSNLTVKAEYVKQYKVTFLDYDGDVLKEEMVDVNTNATPPQNPTLEKYEFSGWDGNYTNVTSNVTITATYSIKTYTVEFIMPDGTVIDEQRVEQGRSAIAPECQEYYFDGQVARGFTKWDSDFNVVTENMQIKAIYESHYTTPLIILKNNGAGNVGLYIYCDDTISLYAIEFLITYNTSMGNISLKDENVSFVDASPLKDNNQYVINNNENTFTFAWSDVFGANFNYSSKLLVFNFSTDADWADITLSVKSCSAVIGDSNGDNLEKVIPIDIYQ